jgi:hypothetical protein
LAAIAATNPLQKSAISIAAVSRGHFQSRSKSAMLDPSGYAN